MYARRNGQNKFGTSDTVNTQSVIVEIRNVVEMRIKLPCPYVFSGFYLDTNIIYSLQFTRSYSI